MMQRKLCASRVLCSLSSSSEAWKRCQLLCQFAPVTGSGHKKTITEVNVHISCLFFLGASRGVASQIAAKQPFFFPPKKSAFPDESRSCAEKDALCIVSILLLLTESLHLVLLFDHTNVKLLLKKHFLNLLLHNKLLKRFRMISAVLTGFHYCKEVTGNYMCIKLNSYIWLLTYRPLCQHIVSQSGTHLYCCLTTHL